MVTRRPVERHYLGPALVFGFMSGATLLAAYAMPDPEPNQTMCQASAADKECAHVDVTCQTFGLALNAECWYCDAYEYPRSCQPIAASLTCTPVANRRCGIPKRGTCQPGIGGGWFICGDGETATPGPGNPTTCMMPNGC
jgi:hypothetical protein